MLTKESEVDKLLPSVKQIHNGVIITKLLTDELQFTLKLIFTVYTDRAAATYVSTMVGGVSVTLCRTLASREIWLVTCKF